MKTNRDKVIKSIVAAFIVTGSVLSLGIKYIADDAALSVDRPTFIRVTPDNDMSLLVGNTIYTIDDNGVTTRVYDFEKKGFRLRGDHDFFSDGDLLVYSSNVEPTFLEKLSQFARIKETRQEPVTGRDGLYRCDYETNDCQLFTADVPAFYTTFRVFIDRVSDTVYLSDTPRFVLYKLDKEGTLLAKNDSNLWFPNQILLHKNNLYIANTNFHSIKEVHSNTEHFAEEIENHKAIIDGDHVWPSEVIKTPENWWVGIADNNMDNSRIQIFDEDWKKLGAPLLKDTDADSRSLALFGSEVWVTDWRNIKIYRFSLSGERLSDFSNKEINQVFSDSNQLVKKYETISLSGLATFFIVFAVGVVAAFVLEKEESLNIFKRKQQNFVDDIDTEELKSPPGEGVYWIDNKMRKYRKLILITFVVLLFLLAWSFSPALSNDDTFGWQFTFMFLSIFPLFILIFWAWYRISETRIGVSGKLLLVDDGQGNVGIGTGDLIKYNKSTLVVNKVVALLGQPHAPLFPKDEMKQWVTPRMHLGKPVGQWYLLRILWTQKHPSIFVSLAVLGYIVMVLLLEFFSL